MTPADVLTYAPAVLSPAQRDAYFRDGYLAAAG